VTVRGGFEGIHERVKIALGVGWPIKIILGASHRRNDYEKHIHVDGAKASSEFQTSEALGYMIG